MKLKTLKDLKPEMMMYGNEEQICHMLKQEAIKWYKEEYKEGEDCCCTCQEAWLKFFNITEEDLKDG